MDTIDVHAGKKKSRKHEAGRGRDGFSSDDDDEEDNVQKKRKTKRVTKDRQRKKKRHQDSTQGDRRGWEPH
jgi:hypothetical protein